MNEGFLMFGKTPEEINRMMSFAIANGYDDTGRVTVMNEEEKRTLEIDFDNYWGVFDGEFCLAAFAVENHARVWFSHIIRETSVSQITKAENPLAQVVDSLTGEVEALRKEMEKFKVVNDILEGLRQQLSTRLESSYAANAALTAQIAHMTDDSNRLAEERKQNDKYRY